MAVEATPAPMVRTELAPEQLRRSLDPSSLPFETTAEVTPLADSIGQPRAVDAMQFGLELRAFGYNLYVAGAAGSGREHTTRAFLEQIAPQQPAPDDWVYVYNFADRDRPRALRLPVGQGAILVRAMDQFIGAAERQLAQVFAGEAYARQKSEVLAPIDRQRECVFSELREFATRQGFALKLTPVGIAASPRVDGQPLTESDFTRLPEQQRHDIEQRGQAVQHAVATALRQAHDLEQQSATELRTLDRDVTAYALGPLLEELCQRFAAAPDVLEYLEQVRQDVPEHLEDFRHDDEDDGPNTSLVSLGQELRHLRYRVNLLVDNDRSHGAPVVVEHNPTYYNLAGRIDYRATLGAMVTDFRQIKPGALHRANGGFLVLHVRDVLANPFAWEVLKRSLMSRAIQIENLGEQYTPLPTASLRPAPIPLDVKVVLIGPAALYHLLYQLDDEFRQLFRVKADFAPDMPWGEEGVAHYAAFISRCVQESGLKHFDRGAVARVVEHGARRCEDQRKLSTRLLEIATLVTEASYWAGKAGRALVQAADVERAVAKHTYRSNLVEERVHELLRDGTITVETSGLRVGHVNGLAVINLDDYEFARPTRVSAQVALGSGTLQSIDREVKLAGPIHSKGFLTLASYLASQYAQEWPLALSASLVFEQSYDEIEGDSASSAELYALLSALAEVPLRQDIAVTGAVNQHGEVQAVGGVTRKVEGFFAVCKARGLSGEQGVLIPRANIPHLMLDEALVETVRAGQFHVWAVGSIDEGLELLTGCPAGARDEGRAFPSGSLHARAEVRLRHYAELRRSLVADLGQLGTGG